MLGSAYPSASKEPYIHKYQSVLLAKQIQEFRHAQRKLLNRATADFIDDRPAEYSKVLVNPDVQCPPEIVQQQIPVELLYQGFDKQPHIGIMEINKQLEAPIEAFFALAWATKFPIERVTPAGHPDFSWEDAKLLAANATSGFNFRTKGGDRAKAKSEFSRHALGLAFDVNARLNPFYYINDAGTWVVEPAGATWDKGNPGVLDAKNDLVQLMKDFGIIWGGDSWDIVVDPQHFELPINAQPGEQLRQIQTN